MTRKTRRIGKLLRRSDYQAALVQYHAAKRRGDPASAQHWLKLADMHLRVADRFDEGVHASLMREVEYEEASQRAARNAREEAARDKDSDARASQASLERLMDKVHRMTEEMEAEAEDDEWEGTEPAAR